MNNQGCTHYWFGISFGIEIGGYCHITSLPNILRDNPLYKVKDLKTGSTVSAERWLMDNPEAVKLWTFNYKI